jgi:hypothetical protein
MISDGDNLDKKFKIPDSFYKSLDKNITFPPPGRLF